MEDNREKRLRVLLNLSKGLEKVEKLISYFEENYNENNLNSPEMKKALDIVKDLNCYNKEFNKEDLTLDSILMFLKEAKEEQIQFIDKYMDYMDSKIAEN